MKPFIYIKKFETFIAKKISVNSEDTKYITGSLNFEEQYGVPDIKFSQIVFIGDINKIWTHGDFFTLSENDIKEMFQSLGYVKYEEYYTLLNRIERIEELISGYNFDNSDDSSNEGIEIVTEKHITKIIYFDKINEVELNSINSLNKEVLNCISKTVYDNESEINIDLPYNYIYVKYDDNTYDEVGYKCNYYIKEDIGVLDTKFLGGKLTYKAPHNIGSDVITLNIMGDYKGHKFLVQKINVYKENYYYPEFNYLYNKDLSSKFEYVNWTAVLNEGNGVPNRFSVDFGLTIKDEYTCDLNLVFNYLGDYINEEDVWEYTGNNGIPYVPNINNEEHTYQIINGNIVIYEIQEYGNQNPLIEIQNYQLNRNNLNGKIVFKQKRYLGYPELDEGYYDDNGINDYTNTPFEIK